jgi:hypothetical protein
LKNELTKYSQLKKGPDCELKIWNLINGKCSYRKTIPNTRRKVPLLACAVPAGQRERPIGLKWSPSASSYSILFPSHLAVYDPNVRTTLTLYE